MGSKPPGDAVSWCSPSHSSRAWDSLGFSDVGGERFSSHLETRQPLRLTHLGPLPLHGPGRSHACVHARDAAQLTAVLPTPAFVLFSPFRVSAPATVFAPASLPPPPRVPPMRSSPRAAVSVPKRSRVAAASHGRPAAFATRAWTPLACCRDTLDLHGSSGCSCPAHG